MAKSKRDPFGALKTVDLAEGRTSFYRIGKLEEDGTVGALDRLPFSIRVLLENTLRHAGGGYVSADHVGAVAKWSPTNSGADVPFMPARVVLQDFTGVPAVVDLAAMRDGIGALGGDPARINPVVPADLVIDHSVQVDFYGSADAFRLNVEKEFERNRERYALLRWAQGAFDNFSVVPPGTGIVHQVNLEYLAPVIHRRKQGRSYVAYPDTLVGTDSHTTMVNGLGVVGWGVGGIEAEAVMLGQPYYMLLPEVVGMKFSGSLPEGSTATDLVLRVTELLRKHGVVDKFVEYYGSGLSNLTLPDKATLANMSPEYGATIGFFPVDEQTLRYLRGTGRPEGLVQRVERISKELGLFRTDHTPDPEYTSKLELDLGTVEPSLAGPRRPQDRVRLADMRRQFEKDLPTLVPSGFAMPSREKAEGEGQPRVGESWAGEGGSERVKVAADPRCITVSCEGQSVEITDGTVVIASITSCTNTSNPSVMVGAGLLAKKAVERGLQVKPWVKTSMAPGSQVVTDYLTAAGLMKYLEALRFHLVGYGCTTCIGNSGPLPETVHKAVEDNGLVVAAVLSGNRNFEARIHPLVRANYLASPVLVVAYALAGRVDIDLYNEPIGHDKSGRPVFLADIWPSPEEVRDTVTSALRPEMFTSRYAVVDTGDENWRSLPVPMESSLYPWDATSTYVQRPPFFEGMSMDVPSLSNIKGARVLAVVGNSVTTDHISPAGSIPKAEPAGQYLLNRGVKVLDFNTFGARRGNHEVMMRGTFGNVRLKNKLLGGREGAYTVHFPTDEITPIYDASMRYQAAGIPLIVIAGTEYGSGSSRDWAAKGTALLGVRAVIAESFERIHRSNLVGMGVLPLEFLSRDTPASLGLTGKETFDITGIEKGLEPGGTVEVLARSDGGDVKRFRADVRLDSDIDLEYYRNGGILQTVLRKMARGEM